MHLLGQPDTFLSLKISHADHGPTLPPVSSRPPGGGGRGSKSPRPQATSPGGTKLPDVKTATPRQGGAALKKKPSKKVDISFFCLGALHSLTTWKIVRRIV